VSKEALTTAAEDFLKAVLELERRTGLAGTNELAARLGVSAPTVTAMAKKLDQQRLVKRTPYRGVTLTERGRLVALEVLRHHRLLELYLADTLGMPLDVVHDEADRLEHVLSEVVERKIDEALGFPTHDPHGDPIPDPKLRLDEPRGTPLATLAIGARGIVTRVPDADSGVLRYLTEIAIAPGASIEVIAKAPFGGPLTIKVGNADHALASELAAAISVA
jgi:DtxR family transcriptional regulator, Mn-dependent transcriptional regulator